MYSRSTDIFTFWREFQTHCVCSLYTRTDPHAAKRAEPAVDDQKEHLMSDQYLMEASLILQNRVTKTLTKKVGTTGGCNKSYYLLTMNLLELHQS